MFEIVAINVVFAIMFFIGMYLIYSGSRPDMTKDERWLRHFFGIGFVVLNGARWFALSGLLTLLIR